MAQTVRQYWRNLRGRTVLNFNWNAIDHDSTVIITASEYSLDINAPNSSPRFVGAADIEVRNISPHSPPYDPNHGVTFVVDIDWPYPLDIVTDITVMDKPWLSQGFPLVWKRLRFVMQHQQQTNWCWAATAASVAAFYNVLTPWIQCTVANAQLGFSDCCGAGASGHCNVGSTLSDALNHVGHLASWQGGSVGFATIKGQIDLNRPLCLRIGWSGGGGHFVAFDGYLTGSTRFVAVDDPWYGPSDVALTTMGGTYQGSGTWTHTYFVQP
jgi:hypothetical protein